MKITDVQNDFELYKFAIDLIVDQWCNGDDDIRLKKYNEFNNSPNSNRQCYVLSSGDCPIGCFVICNDDIKGYPQYNPNLACVCVSPKYRGKGLSRVLMNYAVSTIKKLPTDKLYLKTTLENYYDKFGFEFVKNIEVNNNIEKLYVYDIQKNR